MSHQSWKQVAANILRSKITEPDFTDLTIISNGKFEELIPLLDEADAWNVMMSAAERMMLCMFFSHAFEEP